MKLICHRREIRTMQLANGILGITLAFALSGPGAWAQPTTATTQSSTDTLQTFYLTNVVSQSNDGNEILTAIRNILTPSAKVFFVPGQNAIVVRTTPDQLELVQKLIKDLDRPKKTYRLTYTFTEMDGSKSVGTQHFSMIVISGERTKLKQGSKFPIVTGYESGKSGQLTTTYVDVGQNFDVSLDESVNGVRLRSNVEQSSVAEQVSGVGPQDPIIRQTVLQSTSFLTPGKPLMLGSIDIPSSTQHLDVGVMVEAVK